MKGLKKAMVSASLVQKVLKLGIAGDVIEGRMFRWIMGPLSKWNTAEMSA
jgi:hypothetical protein